MDPGYKVSTSPSYIKILRSSGSASTHAWLGLFKVEFIILKTFKVDTNCDNSIDIFEYLKYILFEHKEKENVLEMSRPKPYPKPFESIAQTHFKADRFVEVSRACLKNHTYFTGFSNLFFKFIFFPGLNRDGVILDKVDHMFGRYVAITLHGSILQFNLNLNLIKRTHLIRDCVKSNRGFDFWDCHGSLAWEHLNRATSRSKSTWVTAMTCIPNMNYIAVADTKHNISFYDVNSAKLSEKIIFLKLPSVVTCMDYRLGLRHLSIHSQCLLY